MAGIDDRLKLFLETWAKRKSGALPSPDLTVSCSACGGLIMGDEEIELVDMEIVCKGCQGSIRGDSDSIAEIPRRDAL